MESIDNRRVLIVDDQHEIHDDFREMLGSDASQSLTDEFASAFLDEEGNGLQFDFELLHATSGEDAVKQVANAQSENRPIAATYMDIRMPPGIDGIEAARRIRRIDRNIEIVIMTAYTDKRLSDIVQNMDMLHKLLYIRKPFAREEIQQITLSLVVKWNVEKKLELGRTHLANSEGRLTAVLDATGDAVAIFDSTGELVAANRPFAALHGTPDDALGLTSDELSRRFEERSRMLPLEGDDAGIDLGTEVIVEQTTADDNRRQFAVSDATVINVQGENIGSLAVLRDVSDAIEAHRMQAEVRRLRAELNTRGPAPD